MVVALSYDLFLFVDVNGTPLNATDDEVWFAIQPPRLQYHAVTSQKGSPIDIEFATPVTLTFIDTSGPSPVPVTTRTKQAPHAHAYGFVNTP